MSTIYFRVAAIPKPKGSMRAFVRGGRPILTSDNPGLKGWEMLVRHEAQRHVTALASGPVEVVLHFLLLRPKSLAKKIGPPHLTKPDVDKLARAVLDALTGVAFQDDAQVVRLECSKRYVGQAQQPGVDVHLSEASDDEPSVFLSQFGHAPPALPAASHLSPVPPAAACPATPLNAPGATPDTPGVASPSPPPRRESAPPVRAREAR